METIQRDRASNSYKPIYDMVPLNVVAAVDRSFPQDWVDRNNADVTDGFVDYARPLIRTGQIIRKNFDSLDKFLEERKRIKSDDPLAVVVPVIGGQRRVTQFDAIYADKTLDDYVPVGERQ
jgi:hypothetical protein